jgi:hypothetical protein
MPEASAPWVQITNFLAIHALEGQNVAIGARLGIRYPKKKDLYLGPEVVVVPPGQSSVVYLHMTGEQQFTLSQDGRITGGMLVYAGIAFPRNVPNVGTEAVTAGGELFVARRIDELARLRVFGRAGLVGGSLSAFGGLAVAFRL